MATVLLVQFAPSITSSAMHFEAVRFYSGLGGIPLASLGAVGIVAAYAPHGNRRLIRILVTTRIATGVLLWFQAPFGSLAVSALGAGQIILAVTLYLCLRMARL